MYIGHFRSFNMNLIYRNPDKIDDYRIECWGFVTKFGKKVSLYSTILTDESKHCCVSRSALHNTISYSNDFDNYIGVYVYN
jgi:hypothetical protein